MGKTFETLRKQDAVTVMIYDDKVLDDEASFNYSPDSQATYDKLCEWADCSKISIYDLDLSPLQIGNYVFTPTHRRRLDILDDGSIDGVFWQIVGKIHWIGTGREVPLQVAFDDHFERVFP